MRGYFNERCLETIKSEPVCKRRTSDADAGWDLPGDRAVEPLHA
jgi:hypothetical protein